MTIIIPNLKLYQSQTVIVIAATCFLSFKKPEVPVPPFSKEIGSTGSAIVISQ